MAPPRPDPPPVPGEVEIVTDRLEKPSLDDRSYRVIRLPNQLEALIVHDPKTDKASAAMDVNVGSFSDEDDMPGMAHAVEHLLFMGNKKYPVENAYHQYISAHSGLTNAYTAATSTNYHFEVSAKPGNEEEPSATNPSPLLGALDRFAQFFIEPLFLETTLDRELQAVDSENKKNLQSDQWRLHQLKKSLSNPKHPFCHFSTGNLETLKTEPEAEGINVRDKFIEFYEKHYSANRMKLCVLGREPLDVLQTWVVEHFSSVRNKNLAPNRWEAEVPFTQAELGTQVFAKPVMDTRELTLTFPFIEQDHLYDSQPSRYISHLIGHEGPGSIMSYIKAKGWANGLYAGAWPVSPGTPEVFECQITLTEEGLKNYQEVVKVVFEYIALMRETEPQAWIFDEQKGLSEVNFRFREKTQSYRFTSKLSSFMHKPLPREYLLSGYSLLRKFDPKMIKEGLECLRPDSFRMTIVSRDFPGTWENKEKWYGTEYTCQPIPTKLMDDIKKAVASEPKSRTAKLHLPHKNEFVPTKLEVEKKDVKEPSLAPRIVRNDPLVRTWFKKDDTFWVPKATLIISCRSPVATASAAGRVKSRLFTDLIKDALEEYSYDAELAGLEYTVTLDSRGLYIEVSGYNDKLAVLLQHVLITTRDLEIRDDRFAIIKERISRGYRNWELSAPWTQIGDYMSWLTIDQGYVVEELEAELPHITPDALRVFQKELLAQMHMEVLAHGNMYKEDALRLTDMIESTLKPRVLSQAQWKIRRGLILPPGSNYIWKKKLKDPANVNHCIQYFLHAGSRGDYNVRAKVLLLDQIVHEPCFNQLRTKEQLGYIVYSGTWTSITQYGFYFVIQSEKTAPYLETRIEEFLKTVAKTLEDMSEAEFESNKRSIIDKRLERLKYMEQESNRHWTHIHSEFYAFDNAPQDAAHIKPLTKADMIEFFNEYIHPSSPSRAKLAVYLEAQAKSDVSTKEITELIKTLELDATASAKAATDLQARLSAADHDVEKELAGLRGYLFHDLKVTEGKMDVAAEAWKKIHAEHGPGNEVVKDAEPPSANGTTPVFIDDVRSFRASLPASNGACPLKDLIIALPQACIWGKQPWKMVLDFSQMQLLKSATAASSWVADAPLPLLVTKIWPFAPIASSVAAAAAAIRSLCASRQLAFTTSSQKKRRITRQSTREHNKPEDLVLPSTEEDDPSFSFSAASTSGLSTPTFLRADSLPRSGVPPRLQSQGLSVADSPSSAASSPCAASTDLSIDFDRAPDLADSRSASQLPDYGTPGNQSSIHQSVRRALMGGAADFPQRSSSPLKRRASSMEPDRDVADAREDVDMIIAPDFHKTEKTEASREEEEDKKETEDSKVPVADMKEELPLRNDIPPLDQQIKTVETLVNAFAETPVKEGDEAYLVSRLWLGRAQAFGSDTKHATKESSDGALGPVDNSDIIQAIFTDSMDQLCVKLKPGMGTENFELFPKDAWDLLLSWYGLVPGQSPIVRLAHNTAPDSVSMPTIQFEFHPPVFTIHRLWSATSPIPIEQEVKLKKPTPPVVVQSTSFGYHHFLKQAKELAGVAADKKVRVWRILQTIPATEPSSEPSGMKTPPDSPGRGPEILTRPPSIPGAWPEMLVDVETFLKLEKDVDRGLVDAEDTTTNANYNGKKSLSLVGLAVDQTLVLDEQVDRDTYVSTYRGSAIKDKALATRGSSTSLVAQTRSNASGRNSPAPQGPLTRGRAQQKPGRTIGCVGLQNLGNTCYMNSALQCVRSVEELTKYFLTQEAKKEINPDNPLSHNGEVAAVYGRLLEEIYKDPAPSAISPRQFKGVIGRYAPAFSGYGQQDSQEFLGFLLDGLQEDLNRIKKKPYIEKPDSTDDMINNPVAVREMAAKVWDITKKRDDSVIADLFTGMYKSTLVCPVCDKVSITFDPFNNLTLPLPVANIWSRTVRFFPLNDTPVEIVVDVDKNSSIRVMKEYISARVGVPAERLFAGEEFHSKFFKLYDDSSAVSDEIQSSDVAVVHELEVAPTNTVGLKKLQAKKERQRSPSHDDDDSSPVDDPRMERMLVPVLHRIDPQEPSVRNKRYGRKSNSDLCPPPHFIVLTPDEARDMEAIRRKILEKVATFTTWSQLAATEDADAAEATDAEMVNTAASDVDSAGDSKVVAKSVEGEDDMVDVTMRDAADAQNASAPGVPKGSSQLLGQFRQRRPKWVNPLEFLDPELQNIFDLSYFAESGSTIPTGWNSTTEEGALPPLSSRQPKPVVSDTEMQSPEPLDGSDESGSEESGKLPASVVTRMAEESSDEDSDFSRHKVRDRHQRGKAYLGCSLTNRAAKKQFSKQPRGGRFQQSAAGAAVETEDSLPGGALLALGEGIMVEWSETAFDHLFGGTSPNEMRGVKTYVSIPKLEDPALEAKQKARQQRKKNGIALDDCLDEFEKEEILSEQDTWYCPRCKEHRRASKKFDLWKTPDILVVHLKRFSSSGWRRDKLDILVDFPVENLDLTKRVIDKEDGKQEVYDLIAVDDHWGGLGGGHYTAFARNFVDGEWYEYNDASVTKQKDMARVVTSAAYLLFYRRRSDVPLGGPRFQEILDRYNQTGPDDIMSESGEGQRLGQGSSQRGSPSASTGAGLTRPQGSLGWDRRGESERPPYRGGGVNHDDDTDMGTWSNQDTLHNSIEGDGEDEGIGLSDYDTAGMTSMTSVIGPSWSFDNLPSKAGSEAGDADIASDVAQNDGSSTNGDDVFDDSAAGMEHLLERPDEPIPEFVDNDDYHVPPPPSADDQDYMGRIAAQTWVQRQIHTVPPVVDLGGVGGDDDDRASDKVAEIHVGGEADGSQTTAPPAGGEKSLA
ncbi:ubiquitin carboxyl-terminal hydrolase [Chaetomidium leptoderma]|uniref:Ubiquitin carboxyl-terminal hydrolase n=1 Tax=Chaetomidium leptoderma TaxID=669021 RepID=A0AAN6VSQ0_9PEZI|nr:ubiquitin carboxyl-terminal hydrolase [Chaetomidium leptoderma]